MYGYSYVLGSKILGGISSLVNAFKTRVLADGGTFEGESNLLNQNINNINDASLVFIPSGYKVNKVYSMKPIDGSGDLTFSRASNAYRYNSLNIFESVGNNIPRINYVSNIPTLLLEPISSNLFYPSDPSSGGSNATFAANDWGIGFINKCTLNNTSGGALIYTSQPTTITTGTTYTASFYVKIIDGTVGTPIFGSGSLSQGYFNLCGTAITSDASYKKTSLGNNIWKIEATGTSGTGSPNNTGFLRWTSNKLGSIEVTGIQIELRSFATSYISTTASTVTRVGDNFVNNNSSNFSSQGTLFISFRNNIAYTNDGTHTNGFYISNGTRAIYFANITAGRIRIWTEGAATIYQTTQDNCRIAITFNGSVLNVWENGSKVVTNYAFPYTFDRIGSATPNTPTFIEKVFLYKEVKDDTYCATLTT